MDTIGLHYGERLTSAGTLGNDVANELQWLIAGLHTWGDAEHNGDGSHSAITADSVVASTLGVDEITIGMFAEPAGTWRKMFEVDPTVGSAFTLRSALGSFSHGTVHANHHTMVGQTLFLTLEEENWDIAAAQAHMEIILPFKHGTTTQWTVKRRHRTYGTGVDNGVVTPVVAVGLADETFIRVYRSDLANWAINAANSSIFTQWHGEVY